MMVRSWVHWVRKALVLACLRMTMYVRLKIVVHGQNSALFGVFLLFGLYVLVGAHTSGLSWSHSVFEWKKAWLAQPVHIQMPDDKDNFVRMQLLPQKPSVPSPAGQHWDQASVQYQMHVPKALEEQSTGAQAKSPDTQKPSSVDLESKTKQSAPVPSLTQGNASNSDGASATTSAPSPVQTLPAVSVLQALLIDPNANVQEQLWKQRMHQERTQTVGFIIWMGVYGLLTVLSALVLAGLYVERTLYDHTKQVQQQGTRSLTDSAHWVYLRAMERSIIYHLILPWSWCMPILWGQNGGTKHRAKKQWALTQWVQHVPLRVMRFVMRFVYPCAPSALLGWASTLLWALASALALMQGPTRMSAVLFLGALVLFSTALIFMMVSGMVMLWNGHMHGIDERRDTYGRLKHAWNRYGVEQTQIWLTQLHIQYMQKIVRLPLLIAAIGLCVLLHPNTYIGVHQMLGWLWVPAHLLQEGGATSTHSIEHISNYWLVALRHVVMLIGCVAVVGLWIIGRYYGSYLRDQMDRLEHQDKGAVAAGQPPVELSTQWVHQWLAALGLSASYLQPSTLAQWEQARSLCGDFVMHQSVDASALWSAHKKYIHAALCTQGQWIDWEALVLRQHAQPMESKKTDLDAISALQRSTKPAKNIEGDKKVRRL